MAYWGCDFYSTSYNDRRLTAANLKVSLRFTARVSKTVSAIYFWVESRKGTTPTYRVGLQADNAGEPSGTFLGYGDTAPISTGFKGVTLETQVALTQGNVYHIVSQYQSGTIDGSNYMGISAGLYPVQNKYPLDMSADANSNCLWYNGTSWSVLDNEPPYRLDFTDETYQIQPYAASTRQRVYGAGFDGERFTVTGGDKVVTDIAFWVMKQGNPPDDLYYTIYNITDEVLVETGTLVTAAACPTSFTWVTKELSASRTLVNGKTYRVYISSPSGGDVTNYYYIRSLMGGGAAPFNVYSWDGTNSVYSFSNDGGDNWAEYTQNDISYRFTLGEAAGYYHGLKVQGVGELALCDAGVNPLRIRKGGVTYGIELVETSDPNASPIRIKTSAGIKAIRKYT